jgi:hypothetical protein
VLGVVLFGERLNHAPLPLAGEGLALALLVGSVVLLSRSPLVRDEESTGSAPPTPPTAPLATPGHGRHPTRPARVALGSARARVSPYAPHAP